jgi:hypothetical protein
MDENGHVQDRIGIEVMKLNAIVIEKTAEEITSRKR